MSSDIKKYLGVYSKNIYVLMAVAATCAIVSQSEKTDAMFRNVLNRAGSIISGVSSSSSTAGARRAVTGARTAMGTPSNPSSTETAPGKVVHDHTGGGTGVFTTNAWGRRLYYGESDASKISKHLGSNVDVDAKYNMYYDADGTPVVTMTKSGKLMRTLAHSEIVRGVFEDPETGQKSQKIVIAGPWWVSGADIKTAGLSAAKSPKDTEGAGAGVGKPVIPSVTVGIIQTTAPSSADASTQTDIDTSSSSGVNPVQKVSVGTNTDLTGNDIERMLSLSTGHSNATNDGIPPAPPLPSASDSSTGAGGDVSVQTRPTGVGSTGTGDTNPSGGATGFLGITSDTLSGAKDKLRPSQTNQGGGNTVSSGAHGITSQDLENAKSKLKKVEITERGPLDDNPGAHGVTPEELLMGKLLLKPTVVVDKTKLGGSVTTDNTGEIINRVTNEGGTSNPSGAGTPQATLTPSGAGTPIGSVISSGGQSSVGPAVPPPTEASGSGSTTPPGSPGLQPVPPLPTGLSDYSGYGGTEVTSSSLQAVVLKPTIIREKGGANGTIYTTRNGDDFTFGRSGSEDQFKGASPAGSRSATPSPSGSPLAPPLSEEGGSGLSSGFKGAFGMSTSTGGGVTGYKATGGDVLVSDESGVEHLAKIKYIPGSGGLTPYQEGRVYASTIPGIGGTSDPSTPRSSTGATYGGSSGSVTPGNGDDTGFVTGLKIEVTGGDGKFRASSESRVVTGQGSDKTSGGVTHLSSLSLRVTSDGRIVKEGESGSTTGGAGSTGTSGDPESRRNYTSVMIVHPDMGRDTSTESKSGTSGGNQTSISDPGKSLDKTYTSRLDLKVEDKGGVITITEKGNTDVQTSGSGQS